VLAKNENDVLPIIPGRYRLIGVVGDQAYTDPIYRGGGSGNVKGQ
jgi:hypothetical protein